MRLVKFNLEYIEGTVAIKYPAEGISAFGSTEIIEEDGVKKVAGVYFGESTELEEWVPPTPEEPAE